ncbi:hypothetical protein PV10_05502 [Exophiala mesophila]|uniref:Uncharacterized protein n=1 Tax=Exophiala mesophila TaxID=212818 RepID=A0A0D1ZVQ7_EXOME|nr:uncharacterized protein PV10_05502 [Exophiala mesophila]KIV90898.1 hypothetical protein PV10_05502 [Exophiala mesophila]
MSMQVAALFSDLKSLTICSHEAALALVTPRAGQDGVNPSTDPSQFVHKAPADSDLQKAQELVSLHYDIKVGISESGLDPELLESRRRVHQVLADLDA